MASKFYIWSVKHSGDVCWWWCPDSKGYTRSLDAAGLYSKDEAQAIERGSRGDARAIPVELAERCVSRMVRDASLRDEMRTWEEDHATG